MKEAIEAVIKDLEARSRQAIYLHNSYSARGETLSEMLQYGKFIAFDSAIDKLKGVLAQHGTDDGGRVPGNVGEEAEQIPI